MKQDIFSVPITRKKILTALISGKTVAVRLSNGKSNGKNVFDHLVETILLNFKIDSLYPQITFSINELISNARKANIKRIYFREKNIDINDPEEYKLGMEGFTRDLSTKSFLLGSETPGYWVKAYFTASEKTLKISVSNNCGMNYYEKLRVLEKQSIAQDAVSISDILLI